MKPEETTNQKHLKPRRESCAKKPFQGETKQDERCDFTCFTVSAMFFAMSEKALDLHHWFLHQLTVTIPACTKSRKTRIRLRQIQPQIAEALEPSQAAKKTNGTVSTGV